MVCLCQQLAEVLQVQAVIEKVVQAQLILEVVETQLLVEVVGAQLLVEEELLLKKSFLLQGLVLFLERVRSIS